MEDYIQQLNSGGLYSRRNGQQPQPDQHQWRQNSYHHGGPAYASYERSSSSSGNVQMMQGRNIPSTRPRVQLYENDERVPLEDSPPLLEWRQAYIQLLNKMKPLPPLRGTRLARPDVGNLEVANLARHNTTQDEQNRRCSSTNGSLVTSSTGKSSRQSKRHRSRPRRRWRHSKASSKASTSNTGPQVVRADMQNTNSEGLHVMDAKDTELKVQLENILYPAVQRAITTSIQACASSSRPDVGNTCRSPMAARMLGTEQLEEPRID